MKKIILLLMLFLFLIISAGCTANASYKKNITTNDRVILAYSEFLKGSINAKDGENIININDIFRYDEDKQIEYNKYALFDMNSDGLPELHVRSVSNYDIFTYQEGQVILWHQAPSYCYPLNNKAIFYTRDGGAPTHIDYAYIICDFYGNEVFSIEFTKGDESNNGNYDKNATFIFDGVEVSKATWDLLTKRYFSVKSDLIEWHVYKQGSLIS